MVGVARRAVTRGAGRTLGFAAEVSQAPLVDEVCGLIGVEEQPPCAGPGREPQFARARRIGRGDGVRGGYEGVQAMEQAIVLGPGAVDGLALGGILGGDGCQRPVR